MNDSHSHTFLFTDLQGSTYLWEVHPALMQRVMARHDILLKKAVEEYGGRVVKTTGDGLHAVFESPLQAVSAALSGQIAIREESWPAETGPLRVRMGLHAGESEEREGDYFGPTLNRAARIMDAGHGGQVLLSEIVAVTTRSSLPKAASLMDLGEHALRDLLSPERIYQLCHPNIPDQFPPIRSLSSYKNNLPVQLTSFVGREAELQSIKDHLNTTRLLTLLGPGGTGKTRLSLQAAADIVDRFPDGVWFVELASLTDPDLLADQIAGVLRVPDQPGKTLRQSVGDFMRLKELLLIFDNVEHLVREAAEIVEFLLRTCPKIRVLVTGREALFIGGETTLQIPSLSLPPKNGRLTLDEMTACESVKLFVDRAMAALPNFQLTEARAPAVAEIVRRLDGIPLALELAAARLRMMSVEQIAARLSDRFRLLTGGQRTALPRQQTLQALIDWSWNLLEEDERILFRRLSVFAGGWTLEAAEAIGGFDGLDVFFCMEQLVNKSLILVDRSQDGLVRYRRLESIRQYSRDRLFESGEGETVRAQHAAYFLGFAEEVSPRLYTAAGMYAYRQLTTELENLRAAVEWCLENQPGTALRITALLLEKESYWISGHEAESWLRNVIDRSRPLLEVEGPGVQRMDFASALTGLAVFLGRTGHTSSAIPIVEEAITIAREDRNRPTLAIALGAKFLVTVPSGIDIDFIPEMEDALELARKNGFDREVVGLCALLGGYYLTVGNDMARGMQFFDGMVEMARRLGDPKSLGMTIELEAYLQMVKGNIDASITAFYESHRNMLQFGDQLRANVSLSAIAHMHRRRGDYQAARDVYRQTLEKWLEIRHLPAIAHQLECFGFLALENKQTEVSAQLLGAASALRVRIDEPRKVAIERAEYDAAVAGLEALLDEARLAELMSEGGRMELDTVVAYALRNASK